MGSFWGQQKCVKEGVSRYSKSLKLLGILGLTLTNTSFLSTLLTVNFLCLSTRHAAPGRQTTRGVAKESITTDATAMADKQFDQEFVEYIIRGIINNPDDVSTERIVDERGVLITLHINQEDMGYVIGRQGQTARAVRTLLKIVGAKENARVNLKIYEPEGSRRPRREDREESNSDDRSSGSDDTSVDDLGI